MLRQFGVMLYPDRPFPVLIERVKWLEELGFDQIFLPDHSGDLRDRRRTWYESWSVLAIASLAIEHIRLGTMVANQILRPPSQLARQATAIDHLSGGRLELGIGAGLSTGTTTAWARTRGRPRSACGSSPTTSRSSMGYSVRTT